MDRKIYPVITYTHCLFRSPVRVFRYRRLSCKSKKIVKIMAKIMAILHDYVLCHERDYGIKYGYGWEPKSCPRSSTGRALGL